jgi:transposase
MWTTKNRRRYDRSALRYPSDLTDDEWAHVESLIPPARRGGNKRHVDVREVMNGIMYVLSTGCQWRAIPKDLPPRSTLFDYLDLWSYDGTLDRIHHALYVECREQGEREASPTAAIIDSQSVKSAEKGGPASIRMAMMRAALGETLPGYEASAWFGICGPKRTPAEVIEKLNREVNVSIADPTPSAVCQSGRHASWRIARRLCQTDLRRGQEVEQSGFGGQYETGMSSKHCGISAGLCRLGVTGYKAQPEQ